MRRADGLLFCVAMCLPLLSGCRFTSDTAPPLPTVAWTDTQDARRILIERQNAIQNVQTQCKLRYTEPSNGGQTQTFDGALVIEGENRIRLRTWKLNQTIFDLTVNPDGVWVVAIDELKEESPDALGNLAQFVEQLGGMLRGPDYREAIFADSIQSNAAKRSGQLRLEWDYGYGLVNPRTLALQDFIVRQEPRNTRITPTYAVYGDLYWFRSLKLDGDFGQLEITFRNVELNGELNPRAFKPPRRAVKIESITEVDAP